MGYTELLEKLKSLPVEKQAVVFDFVEFLATRPGSSKSFAHDDWSDVEFAKFAMWQAKRDMEHESALYLRDDLKEHWG